MAGLFVDQRHIAADGAGDRGDRDQQVQPDFDRAVGFLDFHRDVLLERFHGCLSQVVADFGFAQDAEEGDFHIGHVCLAVGCRDWH